MLPQAKFLRNANTPLWRITAYLGYNESQVGAATTSKHVQKVYRHGHQHIGVKRVTTLVSGQIQFFQLCDSQYVRQIGLYCLF